ncbi:MAG TPA: CHAD domain-containing protein [Acidimicrobiales bacterium]
MAIDAPARAYAVADGSDAGAVLAFLAGRLDVVADPPVARTVTVYDTADRRVRDAGAELRLEPAAGGPGAAGGRAAPAGPGRGRGDAGRSSDGRGGNRGATARLVLRDRPGAPPLVAEVPRANRYLIDDLPPGPLRDRLAPVLEMRALLPLVRLTVETQAARVRNRDEKTVVRLALTATTAHELPAASAGGTAIARLGVGAARDSGADGHGTAAPGDPADGVADDAGADRGGTDGPRRGPVALTPRVEVAGVLGYPRPLARVESLLADELGLIEVTAGPADEAVAALGGDPGGLRSKVRVELRPDQRTDAAAAAVLTDLAGMVEANLPGAVDDLDTEFLHALRVAVRRSRSVLRELKRAFPPGPLAEQRAALRWIQGITGPTRDLDVQLLEWDDLVSRVSPDRAVALGPVHDLVTRHRAAAHRRLKRQLTGGEYARVWAGYRAFLAEVADRAAGGGRPDADDEAPDAARPIARVAGRRIRRVYARMVEMGTTIDDTSPAEALHNLRKRGKELRYLLELFGGLWSAATVKPMVKRLKGLQDVLGTHQDREVQAASLRALAPELADVLGGPDALLALGVLVERLEQEQREARGRFAERFAEFAARDQRALVDETFRAVRA